MGLFDFLKKPKTDVEQYYEDRKKRESTDLDLSNPYYEQPAPIQTAASQAGFRITVEDVFTITGRGTVIVGRVESGSVRVGDTVTLQRVDGSARDVAVTGIEMFRKMTDVANTGDNVGILLRGLTKADIGKGDVLIK